MQNGLNRIDGRIVIVGAGIGGLAAARALALLGAKVPVLEQAPAITEVGAGIQLGPNGTAVMRALGLDQALRDTGTPIGRALVLRNRHGARLARFPMSGLKRPDDYLFVHRADLIKVLEQGARAAGVTIDLGQRITGVRTGTPSDPMAVVETDGKEITAPLVIGADGARDLAFRAGFDRFGTILSELTAELPLLRRPVGTKPKGKIARAMYRAALPHADGLTTPMICVAGAVAAEVLSAMVDAADLTRATGHRTGAALGEPVIRTASHGDDINCAAQGNDKNGRKDGDDTGHVCPLV